MSSANLSWNPTTWSKLNQQCVTYSFTDVRPETELQHPMAVTLEFDTCPFHNGTTRISFIWWSFFMHHTSVHIAIFSCWHPSHITHWCADKFAFVIKWWNVCWFSFMSCTFCFKLRLWPQFGLSYCLIDSWLFTVLVTSNLLCVLVIVKTLF